MHSVEFDEKLVLMRVTLKGYWTLADLRAFETDLVALFHQIRKRHRHFRLLSDSSEFAVQAPEISEEFTKSVASVSKENRGPTAIVVGSMLNKMQLERVLPFPHVRAFTDLEQARTWVLGEALPEEE